MTPSRHTNTETAQSDSEKAQQLASYLRREAANASGDLYVKGKFIVDDVGLSSHEIGQLMCQLQETATDLEIERWSYTSATTWRVSTK